MSQLNKLVAKKNKITAVFTKMQEKLSEILVGLDSELTDTIDQIEVLSRQRLDIKTEIVATVKLHENLSTLTGK